MSSFEGKVIEDVLEALDKRIRDYPIYHAEDEGVRQGMKEAKRIVVGIVNRTRIVKPEEVDVSHLVPPELTFSAFQEITKTTAIYLESCKRAGLPPWTYSLMGLADEAGEVLGKVKKMIRDNNGVLTPEIRESIKDELGDVQYYVARVADDFDIPLSDVAVRNIEKLADRKERGVLEGSGDNR